MSTDPKPFLSPHDYLALERASEERSEYLDGETFAMTGSSRSHNLIVVNLGGELRRELKGRNCELYTHDMRLQVSATGLYTYPDVVVVCGEPRLADDQGDTLLNPTVVLEVLSPSTESYDRGKKFEHYRTLPSLREYLLVRQDEPLIEQFVRQPDDHWLFSATGGLEATVRLPSIDCALALAEVYDRVPGLRALPDLRPPGPRTHSRARRPPVGYPSVPGARTWPTVSISAPASTSCATPTAGRTPTSWCAALAPAPGKRILSIASAGDNSFSPWSRPGPRWWRPTCRRRSSPWSS